MVFFCFSWWLQFTCRLFWSKQNKMCHKLWKLCLFKRQPMTILVQQLLMIGLRQSSGSVRMNSIILFCSNGIYFGIRTCLLYVSTVLQRVYSCWSWDFSPLRTFFDVSFELSVNSSEQGCPLGAEWTSHRLENVAFFSTNHYQWTA